MNDYERVRSMIQEEAAKRNTESMLLEMIDDLVARIDADPDLRHALIREAVRPMVFSSYWLPRP